MAEAATVATPDPPLDWSARDMALSAIDLVRVIGVECVAQEKLRAWADSFRSSALATCYTDGDSMDGVEITPIPDMDALLERWVRTIAGLATAHSHEEYTRADHSMDECLEPLLVAPIAELRVFIGALSELLRADPRIPWIWWSPWEQIVEPVVRKGPDGAVVLLRDDLAAMVAKKAAHRLTAEDWETAMRGALRWRSADQLQKVSAAMDKGGQPTLRGRQSCLFLEVPQDGEPEPAMVVL